MDIAENHYINKSQTEWQMLHMCFHIYVGPAFKIVYIVFMFVHVYLYVKN